MASLKEMKKVSNQKAAYLTHDEVAEVINNQQKVKQSNIVSGIFGDDGTAKSGIGNCLLTQDDMDCGRKLFIMDFDKGVKPLVDEYYSEKDESGEFILDENGERIHNPNIVLMDPTIRFLEGESRGGIDWASTIKMTMSMLFYVEELGPDESCGCIMDGMDTWQKNCEYHMRENELEQKKIGDKVSHKNWYIRDKPYNQALMLAKSLPCPSVFITHLKDVMNGSYEDGQLVVVDRVPEWGKLTPGQMFQKILCTKEEKDGVTEFYAEIQKAKGRLYLEGKKYKIATVKNENEYEWFGFSWDIFK